MATRTWMWALLWSVGMGCASKAPAPEAAAAAPTEEVASVAAEAPEDAVRAAIDAAVAHPDRPADDRARDAARKPADVLAFYGVEPGMTVLDLMAGRGWYTEILARVVGPEGRVYAQNNAYVVEKFADGPLTERLDRMSLPQVARMDAELEALSVSPGSVDVAFLGLFYHDTYWMELPRDAINRGVFEALKPGGVYAVFDHHAEAGSGTRDVKTLHRVERDLVVAEILEAGFVLDAESDLLARPEDDRTLNVFDDAIRGRTDRFVLRFVKPDTAMP